jgi:hypothetical protein
VLTVPLVGHVDLLGHDEEHDEPSDLLKHDQESGPGTVATSAPGLRW